MSLHKILEKTISECNKCYEQGSSPHYDVFSEYEKILTQSEISIKAWFRGEMEKVLKPKRRLTWDGKFYVYKGPKPICNSCRQQVLLAIDKVCGKGRNR